MENSISKNWYMVLIKGLIMILLAILIFKSPVGTLLTYGIWIGAGFIVSGFVRLIQGFSAKGTLDNWGWIILEGLVDLFVGGVFVTHPAISASMLPIIIGFWAAFYGMLLFIDAFSGNGGMMLKLISGIIIFILGAIIIFNPIAAGLTLAVWVGFALFVIGIYNVIISFSLKKSR